MKCGCFARSLNQGEPESDIISFCPLHRSAPDLLAALRNTRECLYRAVRANVDIPGYDPAGHTKIREADAAIAKATGSPSSVRALAGVDDDRR